MFNVTLAAKWTLKFLHVVSTLCIQTMRMESMHAEEVVHWWIKRVSAEITLRVFENPSLVLNLRNFDLDLFKFGEVIFELSFVVV